MNTIDKYKAYVNTAFVKAVEPIVLDHAEGTTCFDEKGASYIDCFSGISVTNAGHGNEKIIAAAKAQMDKLVHCCSYVYHAKPVADLAEKLAAITPGRLKKSFFGNGGAEAIEGAIRLAKQFTGRYEMIGLYGSFHGRSLATLSLTGNFGRKKGGGPYLPGVAFTPAPYCYRCPFKQAGPDTCGLLCAEFLEEVLRCQTSANVALFIAEPVMGEGGILVPPEGFFKVIKEILDKEGILFMADEVQSGFCRTGKMFAIEHYGIEPDIMTMAKGIANGIPMGATVVKPEIADAIKGLTLSTFGGNPISCVAASATIDVIETENLVARAEELGGVLRDGLDAFKERFSFIGDVRGMGLMQGVELVVDEPAGDRTPNPQATAKLFEATRARGMLIGKGGLHGNIVRLAPPMDLSRTQVDEALRILEQAMVDISG